ncbi:MAG: thiamine-phosphate kinase [Gammaproteobacteria bacterium HGW-Gammaproteobacteria-3]|nr:MAG: thiamine-phosphate kinase [Gammaproteobacteria bacterium HGW-Gammaproteobacteria-3]
MSLAEFDLIQRFFAVNPAKNATTRLAIGDDCALLSVPGGQQLAFTTDTMVAGVHFLPDVAPYDLGYKLLAVNLSDLAAMGAAPIAVTLALTMPTADEAWLAAFAQGFWALAERYRVDLIGGDTTSGPLTLTLGAFGLTPEDGALLRSGARSGDWIGMTGRLGDAGLGLKIEQGYCCQSPEQALLRFNRPEPRVDAGLMLRAKASSCIDISDGLAQDLGHVLQLSGVGACLDWDRLPLSDAVKAYIDATGDWTFPLRAGDDYELCFTVPPEVACLLPGDFTFIGVIENTPGLRISRGKTIESLTVQGFEHFSEK